MLSPVFAADVSSLPCVPRRCGRADLWSVHRAARRGCGPPAYGGEPRSSPGARAPAVRRCAVVPTREPVAWPAHGAVMVSSDAHRHGERQLHCVWSRPSRAAAPAGSRRSGGPWRGRWQSPASSTARRACLRARDEFLHERTRRPGCSALYPAVCRGARGEAFLSLALRALRSSRLWAHSLRRSEASSALRGCGGLEAPRYERRSSSRWCCPPALGCRMQAAHLL
jgi:hypothetical protein